MCQAPTQAGALADFCFGKKAKQVQALDASRNCPLGQFLWRETLWSSVSRLGDRYANVTEWFLCLFVADGHV